MTQIEQSLICRICGNSHGNHIHHAREMMYGTRERFPYIECADCGCLQLQEVPGDLARFYPQGYSGHSPAWIEPRSRGRRLRALRTRLLVGPAPWPLGALTRALWSPPYGAWIAGIGVGLEASVLDVGCGSGNLLLRLYRDGFDAVSGIDAYIADDIQYPNGILVRKGTVDDLSGAYDLIMLHHSLEHMSDPVGAFRKLAGHLAARGSLLVRVPLAGSFAWRKYGVCWANLDAPRHIFLHTPRSLSIVAQAARLRVERVIYDSHYKQFTQSELLMLDIPMVDYDRHIRRLFTNADVRNFRLAAKALNAVRDGDSAAFILRHVGTGSGL